MNGISPDAAVRQNLLDRLLHAVKQVQVHFGARQEIATETDLRVSTLCIEWEAVLLHAQKKPKLKPALRITNLSRGGDGTRGSMWPLAKLTLSQEELQRFLHLEHTTSDIGRGRAWLRAAINERTLENYLHTIIGSEEVIRTLYEPNAFVLDQERSSMLPVMAAGLSSIIFSIPIDADYLNSTTRSVDVPVPAVITPIPPSHPHSHHTPAPTIFDRMADNNDDEDNDDDDVIAVSAKDKKKKKKKQRTQRSETPPPRRPTPLEEPPQEVGVALRETDSPILCDSASSSSSRLSLNEEGTSPMYVALETGGVPPNLVSDEAEAAVNATAFVLSATTGQRVDGESGDVGGATQMSAQELREAVLVLVRAKEELEQNNGHLHRQVTELETSRSQLLSDLDSSQTEVQSLRDSHGVQLQALERENDLLREQLKKYVGMLQAQRRESSANNTESLVPSLTDSPGGEGEGRGVEHKLAEMAEMYGELMELNERLHKSLAGKDAVITTLVGSLRQAGLQITVPVDSLPASALQPKVLVDVRIPSVIKRGRGPDQHHVYQVFVRVRSEEWNVYRRYAEFREFHRQLQKHLPQAVSFNFPPKKAIGSKSSQLAEERRLKLQDYLCFVVQLCSTTPTSVVVGRVKSSPSKVKDSRPILQADVTKATLVHLFPFFREDLYVDAQSKPQPKSPSYSGL